VTKRFGPLPEGATLIGIECQACKTKFERGDYLGLVPLGPGPDEEAQQKAREGRAYNAIALPVHWACMTGERVT
jgi:hypothetical protein